MISVRVNGKPVELPGPTPLLEYVRQLGVDPRGIAVEVNGEILQRETYADCTLVEGDAVEIVRMVGGGRVPDRPRPPIAVVRSFVDCINRGDVDGLGRLMTEDHVLRVFDEAPLAGRDANIAAWRGYADAFPDYRIYPDSISEDAGRCDSRPHHGLAPGSARRRGTPANPDLGGRGVPGRRAVLDPGRGHRRQPPPPQPVGARRASPSLGPTSRLR